MNPVERRELMAKKKKSVAEAAWNQMNLESKQAEHSRLAGLFGDLWTKSKNRSSAAHNEVRPDDHDAIINGDTAMKNGSRQIPMSEAEQAGYIGVQGFNYVTGAPYNFLPSTHDALTIGHGRSDFKGHVKYLETPGTVEGAAVMGTFVAR